jgi:hypothetical protein
MRLRASIALLAAVLLGSSCAWQKKAGEPVGVDLPGVATVTSSARISVDPLPSWRAGAAKQAIIDYVVRVSTRGSASNVPERERIAVFDVDGTLWPEQPLPEAAFTIARLKREVVFDPRLASKEPFRSILSGDVDRLSQLPTPAILEAIARTHSGMTDDAFEIGVHTFLVDAKHPRFDVPYTLLAYRPMKDLFTYLRDHKFTIWLSTNGDQSFVRAFAPSTFEVDREHVMGSTFQKELVVEGNRAELRRKPELESFNDREEKAANIERTVGQRPILAAGNVRAAIVRSGGDVAMLSWVRLGERPALAIVVHHDDPVRELAYEEADGATLAAARERGFVVVSMKDDWAQVFDPPPPPDRPRVRGGY